jgi:hypothetical protein
MFNKNVLIATVAISLIQVQIQASVISQGIHGLSSRSNVNAVESGSSLSAADVEVLKVRESTTSQEVEDELNARAALPAPKHSHKPHRSPLRKRSGTAAKAIRSSDRDFQITARLHDEAELNARIALPAPKHKHKPHRGASGKKTARTTEDELVVRSPEEAELKSRTALPEPKHSYKPHRERSTKASDATKTARSDEEEHEEQEDELITDFPTGDDLHSRAAAPAPKKHRKKPHRGGPNKSGRRRRGENGGSNRQGVKV